MEWDRTVRPAGARWESGRYTIDRFARDKGWTYYISIDGRIMGSTRTLRRAQEMADGLSKMKGGRA